MNKNILYITFLLCLSFSSAQSYDFSFDALKSTLLSYYENQTLDNAYKEIQSYHDYIRQKVDDINLNELQQTGGTRVPTLCSSDDYYFYFFHYLPAPLKSLLLDENDDHHILHQRYTSEERHQQFYHTIKTLPPSIHEKAIVAKAELAHYISQVPSSGIHNINANISSTWNEHIDQMKGRLGEIKEVIDVATDDHRKALQEYIDQGMVVVELVDTVSNETKHIIYHNLYKQWADDKQRLENILKQQQRSYNQWESNVNMGFLNTVTTLGPLRRLAEDMYDDAMNRTLTVLTTMVTDNQYHLAEWNNISLNALRDLEHITLSLPTTTTLEQLDHVKRDTKTVLDLWATKLENIKSDSGGSWKAARAIDSIWYNAKNELIYSRWQWKYLVDLWNQEGPYSIVRFFTSSPQ